VATLYNYRYGVSRDLGAMAPIFKKLPVNFDLDVGPIVQNVVPEIALSAAERQNMSVPI
jgi:hypothetical protein